LFFHYVISRIKTSKPMTAEQATLCWPNWTAALHPTNLAEIYMGDKNDTNRHD
jgi:hypothetical protein